MSSFGLFSNKELSRYIESKHEELRRRTDINIDLHIDVGLSFAGKRISLVFYKDMDHVDHHKVIEMYNDIRGILELDMEIER